VWSWAPYALAFAALTVFVWLAGTPGTAPPGWLPVAGACLGVGAHLLNVLPDLADDAATGVRGLPHRLGAARLPAVALVALIAGSVAALVGAAVSPLAWVLTLVALSGLGVVVLRGHGRAPFAAAVGIALADVVLLVVAL
jgi:4-hydroxybenzoate polyprenyltransferase